MNEDHHEHEPAAPPGTASDNLASIRIVVVYLLVGAAWLLATGWLLGQISVEESLLRRLASLREWFFLFLTAIVLFLLIRHNLRRVVRASRRLAASEARYRQMFNQNRAIQLLLDPQTGSVVDANPAACAFYGRPREELVGLPVSAFSETPPEEIARQTAQFLSGQRTSVMARHRLASGETRDVEVFGAPIRLGDAIRLHLIVHDITLRVQVETTLQRTVQQLEALYRGSRVMATAGSFEELLRAFSGPVTQTRPGSVVLYYLEPGREDDLPVFEEVVALPDGERPLPPPEVRLVLKHWGLAYARSAGPGQICVVADTGDPHPALDEPLALTLQEAGVQAVAAIPLHSQTGQVVGVVTFSWEEPQDLRIEERQVYGLLASQLATLVENRRLQMRTEEQASFQRSLFASLPVGVVATDAAGRIVESNAAFSQITGFSRETLLGHTFRTLFEPEQAEMVLRRLQTALRRDLAGAFETELRGEGGESVAVRVHLSTRRDAAGESIGVLAVVEDLTQRRRTEQALHESQRMLHLVMDNIPQTIFWKDREGRYLGCNQAFAVDAGLGSPEEVVGRTDYEMSWRPEEADFYRQVDREVMDSGQPRFNIVEPQLQADGKEAWLRTSKVPLRDASGQIVGILGTYEDITEERLAEEALHESEERFRAIFEQAAVGMAQVAVDGQFLRVNQQLCDLLGYSREELLGRTFQSISHPDDLPADREQRRRLLEREIDTYSLDQRYMHRDGTPIWVNLTASLVGEADGSPKYAVTVVRDITQEKQYQLAEREQRSLAEALRDSAEAITGTLDLDAAIERILENLERVVPHRGAALSLVEGDSARIVRRRRVGETPGEDDLTGLVMPLAETPNLRQMVETMRPLIVPDLREYPGWVFTPSSEWARSYAGAPICLEGEVIGFLGVVAPEVDFYREPHAERLRAFADQAAIAIRNARLYEAEREQRVLAEALRDTAEAITSTLDLDEVFGRILDSVGEVVRHDATCILLIEDGLARCVRARGYAERDLPAWFAALHLPVDRFTNLRQMLSSRQAVLVADTRSDPHWIAVPDGEWIASSLVAPIIVDGQVIGYLNVDGQTPGQFTPADAGRLQIFADQAAIAIRNARLYEAEREQRVLAEALRNTAEAITGTLDLDEVFGRILDSVGQVVPHDAACVFLIEDGVARLAQARGYTERGLGDWLSQLRMPVTEFGTLRQMLTTRQTLLVSDTRQSDLWVVFPETTWIRSHVAAPIVIDGEMIGSLDLDSLTVGQFTAADAERLQIFADQAAIAIKNARLYEAERRQLRLSQTLQDVGALLTAQMSLEDVLERILDLLVRVVHYDSVSVQLIDDAGQLMMIVGRGFPDTVESEAIAGRILAETLSARWAEQDVIVIPDTESDPRWVSKYGNNHIRSWIGAALRVKGRLIGILNVDNLTPGAYDETAGQTVAAFANQAAIAIENVRLYAETRYRNSQLEVLNRITRTGAATYDLNELVRMLADVAAGIIGGDRCYLTLWDPRQRTTIPAAASGNLHEIYIQVPVKPDEVTLTTLALERGTPLIVRSPEDFPELDPSVKRLLQHEFPEEDVLVLPLRAGEQAIGGLLLAFNEHHDFEPAEVAWAMQAAELVALAIARAQAYADLERRVAARTADLSEANERLQEMSRVKDEFVSNVSHELRTPIASIKLYHHLLTARPDKKDAYLDRLNRETDRLEQIVEDLLYLTRMEQERSSFQMQPLDLNSLAELYITDREPLAERRGLTLSSELADGLPSVSGDHMSLGRALGVLLTNALNYTPSGGQVTVRTAQQADGQGRWVSLAVIDTGPGILPDERAMLFERFFRGRVGRDSGAPGTGLGLAIAREIVERHGGRIEIESSGQPGEGACFTIWLPAAGAAPEQETGLAAPESAAEEREHEPDDPARI